MASILPFDEMNSFTTRLRAMYPDGKLPPRKEAKEEEEDIIDEMLDLFLLAYAQGVEVTTENLTVLPFTEIPQGSAQTGRPGGSAEVQQRAERLATYKPTIDDVMKVVNAEVAGKTWKDRTEDYFSNGGTVDDLIRIVETEVHRDANEAALSTAKRAGATKKTWVTMMDEKVRDTHQYLEMMSVGINEDFYTYDGDHAPAPGLFSLPENNINCRCELVFS